MFNSFDEQLKADFRKENVMLYNRDCLEVLEKLPNNSIDLVLTDCPYRVISGGSVSKNTKKPCSGILSHSSELARKGKLFEHNDIKFNEWLPLIYDKLKDNTHCYIFINGRNLCELQTEAEKVGFKYQQLLVWDKGNATPNHYYMNAVEYCLMLRKGNARDINNMGTKNILRFPNQIGNKPHPTAKNPDMLEVLISNSIDLQSNSCVVLDPFVGSGSTAIACQKLGVNCIGIEIDEEWFNVAKIRLEAVYNT